MAAGWIVSTVDCAARLAGVAFALEKVTGSMSASATVVATVTDIGDPGGTIGAAGGMNVAVGRSANVVLQPVLPWI